MHNGYDKTLGVTRSPICDKEALRRNQGHIMSMEMPKAVRSVFLYIKKSARLVAVVLPNLSTRRLERACLP